MSNARNLADLLDSNGDVKTASLDNATTSLSDLGITKTSSEINALSSFDDNKIINDISTLALRQASDSNKSAYNTNSQSVDVFQDSSGIDTHTNTGRDSENEFVASAYSNLLPFTSDSNTKLLIHSDTSDNSASFTDSSGNNTFALENARHKIAQSKIGSSSIYFNSTSLSISNSTNCNWGRFSNTWTVEMWVYPTSYNQPFITIGSHNSNTVGAMGMNSSGQVYIRTDAGGDWDWGNSAETVTSSSLTINAWNHIAFSNNNGSIKGFINGTEDVSGSHSKTNSYTNPFFLGSYFNVPTWYAGYMDEIRISNTARYTSDFTPNDNGIDNATGNFTSTTTTASSSVSSMGAIITYQDYAGTNALNTDIILQLSADGGSNWSTATLIAMPDFSNGIKMAKVNDLAVTAGTSLKYKISFANQSIGSKEARIRGVALQY